MKRQHHFRSPSSRHLSSGRLSGTQTPGESGGSRQGTATLLNREAGVAHRRAKRQYGWRRREYARRNEPRKYIFKNGKVIEDKSPYALLNSPQRDSGHGGAVLFVAVPPAEPKEKKEKR